MKTIQLVCRTVVAVLGLLALALSGGRAMAQGEKEAAAKDAPAGGKIEARGKPFPADAEHQQELNEGPEFLKRRQNWFYQPRAFPIGFIPQGSRERAFKQMKEMYQKEGRLSLQGISLGGIPAPPLGPSSAWFSVGPAATLTSFNGGLTSGRVTALAVNPMNPNNVYLGGADGGLWISTNAGVSWTSLTDSPPSTGIPTVAVGAIALDPTSCSATICTTVYVGTGEDNFSGDNIYGEGILKCTISGPSPMAVCTQDNTFHFSNDLPLTNARGGPLVGALAVNRTSGKSNILLAAVRGLLNTNIPSGIWCSEDSGGTWIRVLPTGASSVSVVGTDVAFGSDGTAWAALGSPGGDTANNGVYRSGAPVTACTGASAPVFTRQTLPAAFTGKVGRITLAVAPSLNSTVFAAVADSSTGSLNLLGVAKTTTGTAATPTWTQLTAAVVSSGGGVCDSQCIYDIPLAVHPTDPNTVYMGGAAGNGTLIRSTDGGTTWTEISRNDVPGAADTIHVDMHAIAFTNDASVMYVGNDGGVWSTSTPKGTPSTGFWTNRNANLAITQFYPGVSIHTSSTGFAMGGTQDNGVQEYQGFLNEPLTWLDAGFGCDGGFTVIDFNIPSTSYGECEYIPSRLLLIGTSISNGDFSGGNGLVVINGINGSDRGSFIPPLVIDPSNSKTLYFGTCRVYRTSDSGLNWAAISPDVTSSGHAADCSSASGGALSTIAAAPKTSNTIYAGSDTGDVEVTANGGTTWTSIAANGGTLPTRAVTQVAVDPSSAAGDIAYVAFSGFGTCANAAINCDGKGHVFKTVNGTAGPTAIWVDVSGITNKLPDIPVNAIVIDPDDQTHNTLYVGTDIGAFFTTDGGANWFPLGALGSLPNAQILSLTLHNPSRTLRAATHGRSVWDLNLGPGPNTPAFLLSSLSPFSIRAPGAQTTLTVDGTGFTNASTVQWNGSPLTTTFVSATQLTATITAADLAAGGVVPVTVKDGANTTNALPFTVLGGPPTITSAAPGNANVNGPMTTITVTGTGFTSSSKVLMNPDVGGTAIPTTFTDSTHLSATVPASFLAGFGSTNSVGVQNPPPGGGTTLTSSVPPVVVLPTFVVTASAPTNNSFTSALGITSTNFTDTEDSSAATTETNDPTPPTTCAATGSGRSNTIWYKVAPTGSGVANIDTIGSSYDTVLSVWTGSGSTEASLTATSVACSDDISSGVVTASQLTNVNLTAGNTYYIMVSSFGSADPNPIAFGGKSVLNFSFSGTLGGGGTGSFSVSVPSTAVNIQALDGTTNSVQVQVTVHPTGGFTGGVPVTCTNLPPGVSCDPLTIQVTSAADATGSLNVKLVGPSTTLTAMALPRRDAMPSSAGRLGLVAAGTGSGLAAFILLFLPGRKRLRAALGLGLVCVISLALGCGGGYGGGGGTTTYSTTTKLTLTPPAKEPSTAANFMFAVNVIGGGVTPTGSVQLLDAGGNLGATSTLNNGTVNITENGLIPVGTHAISARYAGDSTHTGSTSGGINCTVTGPTTVTIAAQGATPGGNQTLNINITP